MFGKRCSLCGGKLVDNKCTLCGLDNSKSDANYRVNVSSCDDEPLTHVHESVSEEKYESEQTGMKPEKIPKKRKNTKNVKKSGKGWIVVAVAIALAIGMEGVQEFQSWVSDLVDEWRGEETGLSGGNMGTVEYEDFQYEYVTRELSETGQLYDAELGQGEYIVGVHIPEGSYTVEKIKGDYTYLMLDDFENMIYIGEDFSSGVGKIENLRCYTGAKICIDGKDVSLRFQTKNGQNDATESLENPLEESVDVKNGYVAGVDFPAGTYDIVEAQSMNTGKEFSYIVPGTVVESSETEDYEPTTNMLWVDATDCSYIYKNLYFPEGTKIVMEEGEAVHLEPSEVIASSYEGYYYEYE